MKYIIVYPEIDDYDVYVHEHHNAIKVREDYYKLIRWDSDAVYEPEFDTVRITDDEIPKFYIVTKNSDLTYENECITKLLNHKLFKAKEEYEKLGELIKNFSNRRYSVSRGMI